MLCTEQDGVLGSLPAFEVPSPWWRDVAEVVAAARTLHGVDAVVLRLLDVREREIVDGGPVTYLAQGERAPDIHGPTLTPWSGDPLAAEPLRAPYAVPGGPQADVHWALGVLASRGIPVTGAAEQIRTWNLSSIWRLPTADGPTWLKVVPPFLAHEGGVLALLDGTDPDVVPTLLGHDGGRLLLADIPGTDRYAARGAELTRMVELLVRLQVAFTRRCDEITALGAPDWRENAFVPRAQALVTAAAVMADPLDTDELNRLQEVVAGLPARFASLADCGLPDTLVHGDFHPGNVRGTARQLVLLDWGDSGAGHPLLDQSAFCQRLEVDDRAAVLATWRRLWRDAMPGCDPRRAGDLLGPITALRAAVVYQHFLDSIEPDEGAYHRYDPAVWLRRAIAG